MEIKDYLEKLESNKKEIEYLDYCNGCLKHSIMLELKNKSMAWLFVPQELSTYKDVQNNGKKSEFYKTVLYSVQHYVPSAKRIEKIVEYCSHGFETSYVDVWFNDKWYVHMPLVDRIDERDVFYGNDNVNKWAFEVGLWKHEGCCNTWIAGGEGIKDVVIE